MGRRMSNKEDFTAALVKDSTHLDFLQRNYHKTKWQLIQEHSLPTK